MSLSLNVLNHLGLNLYSNVPAVLSEAVANAWDADAENVGVQIDPEEDKIEIVDDGHGMDYRDVNYRYLRVGYRRREDQSRPNRTPKHDRPVMGRKGIGKLSLLSIAETVDVYTTDGDERHAFRLNVNDIKEAIGEEAPDEDGSSTQSYTPEPLTHFPDDLESGTRIILRDLKKRVHTTETALRKRIARRFSILGAEYNFTVSINGTTVDVTDRDYFHKVQFLWTYGDDSYADNCREKRLENHEPRPTTTAEGYEIEGWIGTVEKPSDLVEKHPGEESEADDLNKISLMVRGRMAKPDLLEDFNDSRMYTKYLVGEIHADFLDYDEYEDIATSNREDVVKEDPRYQALLDFLGDELNRIASRWDDLRNEKGSEAAREIDAIDMWYESLSPENREQARKLFGRLNRMAIEDENDRRELFKHGVLAFENLKYEENLKRLEETEIGDSRELAHAITDFDDVGRTRYNQIATQRAKLVDQLRRQVTEGTLSKRVWSRIRERPWLLSPAWERSATDERLQQEFDRRFDENTDERQRDSKEVQRSPPTYVRSAGRHVLVHLLPPDCEVTTQDVVPHVERGHKALEEVLDDDRTEDRTESVIVVGSPPADYADPEEGRELRRILHEQYDTRIETYESLLTEAADAYESYLNGDSGRGQVSRLIEAIETDGAFQ
ncbi:ATP-binding protein [Halobacteriales archaeon QS_1_68_17]|nr:MAG: ATP-binding protein [Halobacteriales archaeon QS_1_68_17]